MSNSTFPTGISRTTVPEKLTRDLLALFDEIAQAQIALARKLDRTSRLLEERKDDRS